MHISSKQFDYLTTMGISLWQPRDGVYPNNQPQNNKDTDAAVVSRSINKTPLPKIASNNAMPDGTNTDTGITGENGESAASPPLTSNDKALIEPSVMVQAGLTNKAQTRYKPRVFTSVDDAISQPFIKDVIIALGLDDNQVTLAENGLMLGKLHWQISTPEVCTLNQQKLITTNIQELCNSAAHKAQLWRCLSTYLNQQ